MQTLIKDLTVTYMMINGQITSETAIDMDLAELSQYPEADVHLALARCRREVTGRLKLAHIIERIPSARPGPNEAWAMCPRTEEDSVVWTTEIAKAYFRAMRIEGDHIAQRMAFLESYTKLVRIAEERREPVKWEYSPGSYAPGRLPVLKEAVEKGRLSPDHLLGTVEAESSGRALLRQSNTEDCQADSNPTPEWIQGLIAKMGGLKF